ncbi:unnamed protein product [Cladocopium goreaui]|uniref:Peptidase A1 domain-containing protein n=1 Tax=Cladocopium goreaui TaxID=2562237 RepID=A0A9P1FYH4_9DINO|nr:unnamed protein product [Cladocopium goreaui]
MVAVLPRIQRIASARLYGNVYDYAYYFLDLSVGTPPQRVSVIVDTGSSITAFPCQTCRGCGSHIDPLYDITKSSTARWHQCGQDCKASSCKSNHCTYHQGYTEGSSIGGWWFEDVVRLGDLFQHNPQMRAALGCHQEETRLFYTQKANGIMGIRQPPTGDPTLLQQLLRDREHINADVFSMCIAESGGHLAVGGPNTSYHRGEVKHLKMRLSGGFFNVQLTELSIAGSIATDFRNTIIDSGTTWTYFGSRPYQTIRKGIEDFCGTHQSCGSLSGSCWHVSDLKGFPDMEMNFEGVKVNWVPRAYLHKGKGSQRWCYSFQDDGPGASTVLGASWMMHQDVIFDMPQQMVGVVPAECPEYSTRPEHDPSMEDLSTPFTSAPSIQPPAKRFKAKKFNIGLLWAGLASGACLATGFISIVAAACRPAGESDDKVQTKNAKNGEVVGAQTEEEDELLERQEGTSTQNFLKIA